MGNEPGQAMLAVAVCFATQSAVWHRELCLPAGATVRQAIAASGFAQAFPGVDPAVSGTGVYGKARALDDVLHDQDRVEIYRPLSFDPMESRRRRVRHKAAKKARATHKLGKSAAK